MERVRKRGNTGKENNDKEIQKGTKEKRTRGKKENNDIRK